ncbi:MAG: hypothetical protein IJN15_02105 [Clostridia bacterium]|nr:hypothetical protein [Clostridia bacterium]
MVKKLIKHELIYYSRNLLLAEVIIIAFGFLNRFIQLFENDTDVYSTLFSTSLVTLVIGCFLCPLFALILSVIRFYRNFYASEGYLTFTLPVTVNQHLIAKIITAFVAQFSAILTILIALAAASMGDLLNEVVKAIIFLIKELYNNIGNQIWLYTFEILLLISVFTVSGFLFYFCCISLGQRSKRNRILAAVLIYFGFNVVSQFIASFVSLGVSLAAMNIDFTWFSDLLKTHPYTTTHIILLIITLLAASWVALMYFIIHRNTSKKLNLE